MTARVLGPARPRLYLLAAVRALLLAWSAVGPHLVLFGRHRRTAVVGGYHWRYCGHRSHGLRLPCWRWFVYDGYCARHNTSCWSSCEGANR